MMNDKYRKKIAEIKKYIVSNIKTVNYIPDLAKKFGISEKTLREKFFLYTGFTPMQYINKKRLERFEFLVKSELNGMVRKLAWYAAEIGLSSASSICSLTKRATGMTCKKFIRRIKKKK